MKKGSLKLVLYKYIKIFSSNDILDWNFNRDIKYLIETLKWNFNENIRCLIETLKWNFNENIRCLIETLNEALKIPNLKISIKLFKYRYWKFF